MADPIVTIHNETKNYGFGYRYETNGQQHMGRGLDPNELNAMKQALVQESNRHQPEIEALNNV